MKYKTRHFLQDTKEGGKAIYGKDSMRKETEFTKIIETEILLKNMEKMWLLFIPEFATFNPLELQGAPYQHKGLRNVWASLLLPSTQSLRFTDFGDIT